MPLIDRRYLGRPGASSHGPTASEPQPEQPVSEEPRRSHGSADPASVRQFLIRQDTSSRSDINFTSEQDIKTLLWIIGILIGVFLLALIF